MNGRTHRRSEALILAVLALSMLGTGTGSAEDLGSLSFLVGHWRSCSPTAEAGVERCTEEWWTPAGGELMLGMNRDYQTGQPAFFEYLRIEKRGNELVYVASPRGAAATEFAIVELEGGAARFENADHDWPQRLDYRRTGKQLELTASGLDAQARVAKWVLELVE